MLLDRANKDLGLKPPRVLKTGAKSLGEVTPLIVLQRKDRCALSTSPVRHSARFRRALFLNAEPRLAFSRRRIKPANVNDGLSIQSVVATQVSKADGLFSAKSKIALA